MCWTVEYIKEALCDLKQLDAYNRKVILRAIDKTAEHPLPSPEGYGKPLGNKNSSRLSGCYKIKLRDLGYRVVYSLVRDKKVMRIIVIAIREDDEVYKEAERRISLLKMNIE